MSVTLIDVADKAGVSIGVVSAVVNKRNGVIRVSDETRVRVLDAISELGYHTNAFGKSLRTQKSRLLGCILYDIGDPFYAQVISGMETACFANGYHYLLSGSGEYVEQERFYYKIYREKSVDGIVISGLALKVNDRAIIELVEDNFPVVLLNREVEDCNVPYVMVDNIEGGAMAVEHLIGLGHERIGFISGEQDRLDCRERFTGYKTALKKHGLKYDEAMVVHGTHTLQGGYEAMGKLVSDGKIPTAVFAYNDLSALGAMKAIKEAGLKIPEDISVVGFDDIAFAEYSDPSLTTVKQPMFEIGKTVITMLVKVIEQGKRQSPRVAPELKEVLKPELIVRGSTGHCRRRV